jgi:hypothetical protein
LLLDNFDSLIKVSVNKSFVEIGCRTADIFEGTRQEGHNGTLFHSFSRYRILSEAHNLLVPPWVRCLIAQSKKKKYIKLHTL